METGARTTVCPSVRKIPVATTLITEATTGEDGTIYIYIRELIAAEL